MRRGEDLAVVATLPPAGHDVVTLVYLRHKRGDVFIRMRFQVTRQEDDDVARAIAEAGAQGLGETLVAAMAEHTDVRVAQCSGFGLGQRTVSRAVVDEKDLAPDAQLLEGTVDPLDHGRDVALLVSGRHQDRYALRLDALHRQAMASNNSRLTV